MQMPRLEILHEVSCLLSSGLGDAARDEVRDDVVGLNDRKDQLTDLSDGRYSAGGKLMGKSEARRSDVRIQVGLAQGAYAAEGGGQQRSGGDRYGASYPRILKIEARTSAIIVAHHLIPSSPNTTPTNATHRIQLSTTPPPTTRMSASRSSASVSTSSTSSSKSSSSSSYGCTTALTRCFFFSGAQTEERATIVMERIDSAIMIARAGQRIHPVQTRSVRGASCLRRSHEPRAPSTELETGPGAQPAYLDKGLRKAQPKSMPCVARFSQSKKRATRTRDRTTFIDAVIGSPIRMPCPIYENDGENLRKR